MSDPIISCGDRVRLGDREGEVTEVTAMGVRVRLDDGVRVRADARVLRRVGPEPEPEAPAADEKARRPAANKMRRRGADK